MSSLLKGIYTLEGVHGTFLFDMEGQLLQSQAHALYDENLLQEMCKHLLRTTESAQLQVNDWEGVVVTFSDGKLFLRNLGGVVLVVVADSRLNESFAKVAIRMAINQIKKFIHDGVFQPPPPSAAELPAPSQHSVSSIPQNPRYQTPPPMGHHQTPSSFRAQVGATQPSYSSDGSLSMSWSGMSGSGMSASSVLSVADDVSKGFLSLSSKVLAKYVGPVAKRLVKRNAAKLMGGSPFSMDHAELLINVLEKEVPEPDQKVEFRKFIRMKLREYLRR